MGLVHSYLPPEDVFDPGGELVVGLADLEDDDPVKVGEGHGQEAGDLTQALAERTAEVFQNHVKQSRYADSQAKFQNKF